MRTEKLLARAQPLVLLLFFRRELLEHLFHFLVNRLLILALVAAESLRGSPAPYVFLAGRVANVDDEGSHGNLLHLSDRIAAKSSPAASPAASPTPAASPSRSPTETAHVSGVEPGLLCDCAVKDDGQVRIALNSRESFSRKLSFYGPLDPLVRQRFRRGRTLDKGVGLELLEIGVLVEVNIYFLR